MEYRIIKAEPIKWNMAFKHDRLHFWIKFFQLFMRSLWWEVVLEYFKHK